MFKKIVGNEHVKNALRNLVAKGRVPNSMLFAGDEGVGKREFAIELCRAIMCTEATQGEACSICSACQRIGTFTFPRPDDKEGHKRVIFSGHPDVGMVIAYNRNISVDAIRHLESEANFRPYEASLRVFIIDNAEKMNDSAANALLKTLEEPPADSHIFLITSRADSLLQTIRSRCQVLRFAPVSPAEIEEHLVSDRAFTRDEARLAARLARGSIGRAVAIDFAKFRTRRERMFGVVSGALETGDRAGLLKVSEEMNDAKNKDAFEESLDVLASLLHDVWALHVSDDPSRLINTDLESKLIMLTRLPAAGRIPAWLGELDTLRENLAVNINRKLAADALFIGMSAC